MRILRDHVRRLAVVRFFADLPPIDRATFLIGTVLAFVLAVSIERITHAPAADAIEAAATSRGRS